MSVNEITEMKMVLIRHQGCVNRVRWTDDGRFCMTAGEDRSVYLWNPFKPEPASVTQKDALLIKEYPFIHSYRVTDVIIRSDNSQFASCGGDKFVLTSDVTTGRSIARHGNHEHRINSIAYNHDCSVIGSASYDKTVKLWDTKSQNRDPIQTLQDATDNVSCVCFRGDYILTSSSDGCARIYDMRMGQLSCDAFHSPLTSISPSNDNMCYLVSKLGSQLHLVESSNGRLLKSYSHHVHNQYSINSSLSTDDSKVMTCSEDGLVVVWNITDSVSPVAIVRRPSSSCCSISLSIRPSSSSSCDVLIGYSDGMVAYWCL